MCPQPSPEVTMTSHSPAQTLSTRTIYATAGTPCFCVNPFIRALPKTHGRPTSRWSPEVPDRIHWECFSLANLHCSFPSIGMTQPSERGRASDLPFHTFFLGRKIPKLHRDVLLLGTIAFNVVFECFPATMTFLFSYF